MVYVNDVASINDEHITIGKNAIQEMTSVHVVASNLPGVLRRWLYCRSSGGGMSGTVVITVIEHRDGYSSVVFPAGSTNGIGVLIVRPLVA